jgi:nucleoside-diphosphate-sugar epimerase
MVYGEHDYQRREEFILRRVRASRARIPIGPGTFLWSKGYVREIARGVGLALESENAVGEIFNLCEAKTWSVRSWAEQILRASGSPAELVRVSEHALPEDLRVTESASQHVLIVPDKAGEWLGWVHADPEGAVQRSVDWHLAHPPEDAATDFSEDDRALSAADGNT